MTQESSPAPQFENISFSLVAQMVKNLPAMQETFIRSQGWEGPLEESLATHSSILAWRISLDRGAWRAAVHMVTKSRTWLTDYAQHTQHCVPCTMLSIFHIIYITFYIMFPIYQQGSHAHFADEENLRLRRPSQLPRFQNHYMTELDMEPRLI